LPLRSWLIVDSSAASAGLLPATWPTATPVKLPAASVLQAQKASALPWRQATR
jgi:hypothetical protein